MRAPSANLSKLNINTLIKDVSMLYENVRDEAVNEHSSVKITYDLMPNMPDILGDATMLRQVLHNLMQNAQDALVPLEEHSTVENQAADNKLMDDQAERNQPIKQPEILVQTTFNESTIKLVVRDNGQGFPAALISHAYEPYVTTKAHGTGLGLAIVKKMVDEHAGHIKIENNISGGACVTILLPIIQDVKRK